MIAFSEHRRRPRRKTRQPIDTAKAKRAKTVLLGLFAADWRRLPLEPLEERVTACRREAVRRVLSLAEWRQLDRMRDQMRVLQKFERATHEARPR
jgi:hypothetical protein